MAMFSVREIQAQDIGPICDYWFKADDAFLVGMGVDLNKMPTREAFTQRLQEQLSASYKEKKAYCIVWLLDGEPVGHNNVNDIVFGEQANMHLHMWKPDVRKKGMGTEFIKLALPHFFKNLQLKVLYCEPSAANPAPNKTLPKAGFEFIKAYSTVPSTICSEQLVNQWRITLEQFKKLK